MADAEAAAKEGRVERTGYDVLLWVAEQVHSVPGFVVPTLVVHPANAAGRERMARAIESSERIQRCHHRP